MRICSKNRCEIQDLSIRHPARRPERRDVQHRQPDQAGYDPRPEGFAVVAHAGTVLGEWKLREGEPAERLLDQQSRKGNAGRILKFNSTTGIRCWGIRRSRSDEKL